MIRRTFGFISSGHFPPIELKRLSPSSTTDAATNTWSIAPPFSHCCLLPTTVSPVAAALPGTPSYECITKRTSFPFSTRRCSNLHRKDVASLAAVAIRGLLQFKEGSGRQWASNFESSRMIETFR